MIDFSTLALSPNESRAARNFLGLSQAQAAAKSNLQAHKLKRFETGNYVPDGQFLEELREFYEQEGFNFHDERAPGAKAKMQGDVFPAGVVGETDGSTEETDGFTEENQGKPQRPKVANIQYMRIAPSLSTDQVDRMLDGIDENEAYLFETMDRPSTTGFLGDGPSAQTQALAISILRRLAENGILYARLMGRTLVPTVERADENGKVVKAAPRLFASTGTVAPAFKTVGELLAYALSDAQTATVDGDKGAQARRKGRAEPSEVLQALIG